MTAKRFLPKSVTDTVDGTTRDGINMAAGRRAFMQTVGLGVAGAALLGPGSVQPAQAQATITDNDILNFALNLEYLEAEFYLRAATGAGLNPGEYSQGSNASKTGPGVGSVSGGRQVSFATDSIRNYAFEIAVEERIHVNYLRNALGQNRVGRPPINIGTAFTAAAQAAGLGNNFDAYADELSFLLAAFIFEDVGVSAYLGAAPLITNKGILSAAGGILAAEAYHAGAIRTVLYGRGAFAQTQAISNARDSLDGSSEDDQGIGTATTANVSLTDPSNGQAYARSTGNVLNIVYLNTAGSKTSAGYPTPGGFFPLGINGVIQA